MLVLSRKALESITIGTGADQVVVTVLGYDRSRGVKLGITAPRDVPVDRVEVRNRADFNPHRRGGEP